MKLLLYRYIAVIVVFIFPNFLHVVFHKMEFDMVFVFFSEKLSDTFWAFKHGHVVNPEL